MDWDVVAPMIASMTLFLCIAGVLIFRPLATRVGDLLKQMQQERQAGMDAADMARLTEVLERLADRMDRLEERQDFAERLLEKTESSRPEPATRSRDRMEL